MGTQQIGVTVAAAAPARLVWDVLADSANYAKWGVWDESSIERPGRTEAQGVGAIRRLRQGKRTLREEIVAYEPGTRLDYAVLSGIPVRQYVGRVVLADDGRGGTTISWSSTFSAWPVLDVLIRRKLEKVIDDVARRMAAYAASMNENEASDHSEA